MSFISLFQIIKLVVHGAEDEGRPEPCILFLIPAPIAEAAAVISSRTKIFFARGTANFINELLVYLIMILKTLEIELF